MKILIDDQFFSQQIYGGISRYHYELYRHLSKLDNVSCKISLVYSHNEYVKHIFRNSPVKELIFKSKKFTRIINRIYSAYSIARGNFDLLHPTYYNPYFLKFIGNKPFVITAYDMIPELFYDKGHNEELIANKKLLMKKAAAIISISQNTKNDLLKLYDIKEEKVKVIHLGHSISSKKKSPPESVTSSKYILYVGERGMYKNFVFFITSVADLLIKYNLHVVCAGGRSFTGEEYALFEKLRLTGLMRQINASEEELNSLYEKASFFVFPSLYEGFGIPVLEAFYNNCALLCGDRGSLPEVAGDAAIYFNPEDSSDIKKQVLFSIENPDVLTDLKIKGKKRLALFSWEKNAEQTLEVYKSVL